MSREELKARDEIERRIVRLSRPNGSPIPTSGPFSPLVPGERLLIPGRRKKKKIHLRDATRIFLGADMKSEVWHASTDYVPLEGFSFEDDRIFPRMTMFIIA